MKFVQMNSPNAPEVDGVGEVQYVGYWHQQYKGKSFFTIFPNGAKTINNRVMYAICDTVEAAWDKCVKNEKLMREFGATITP